MGKKYFDGATNQKGYGLGVILIAPGGAHTTLAIKLKYTSTNNKAKYVACVIGMEAALSLGVENIDIFRNSYLIISKIRGEWKVKHKKLRSYNEYLVCLEPDLNKSPFTIYLEKRTN